MPQTKPTSEQVTFLQAGTGATQRTALAKLRDTVSVKDFGAVGDGTTNDIVAVQAAMDALNAVGGGTLKFPAGTYLFSGNYTPISNASRMVDGVTLRSNVSIVGDGPSTIIKMSANCCYAFTGRFRATPVTNLTNIEFKNLSFQMPITPHDAGGGGVWFEEQLVLFIDSVENCLIENCQFIRWSGDAIMLGGPLVDLVSPFAAGIVKNVRITGCLFDGVDKDNRNAISILDGDRIEIDNNIFLNTSRTDMPGAIDVEPENVASVLVNISVHDNKFVNIGGGVAAVGFALGTNLTVAAKDFSVHNNQFKDCTSATIFTLNGKSSANPLAIAANSPQRISFTNNNVDGLNYSAAFSVRGCDEATISDNIFSDLGTSRIGLYFGVTPAPLRNFNFTGNTFRNCHVISADTFTGLIQIKSNIIGGVISENKFISCGRWSDSTTPATMEVFAWETASKDCSYLVINNNLITSNGLAYSATHPIFYFPSADVLAYPALVYISDNKYIGAYESNLTTSLYYQATSSVSRETIKFPVVQLNSSNPNVFDDYKEGTWNPTLTGFTIVGSPTVVGTYTKIGRLVFFTVRISGATSTTNAAGTGNISNLPFTVQGASSVCSVVDESTFVGTTTGYLPSSTTQCYPPAWTITANAKTINGVYNTST
jgi:hypothetical protein